MAERRALCAGCRKPLYGQLVANSCNHVFHSHCLSSGSSCARCQHPLQPEKALSLFGLGFEEVDDAMSVSLMAAMAQLQADSDDEALRPEESGNTAEELQDLICLGPTVLDDSQEAPAEKTQLDASQANPAMPEAARICFLRQKSRRMTEKIDAEKGEVMKAREFMQEQHKKLKDAEKIRKKIDSDCSELTNSALQSQEKQEQMLLKVNQLRQRDAALAYWEELRLGGPEASEAALQALTTTVALVGNPEKVLTQVARLRDHHRQKRASWEKDMAQESRRQQRAERDRHEQMRIVTDLKAKIQQQKELLRLATKSSEPPAKRPRS